jgi:ABC-type sugar transport system permease subunit
VEWRPPLSLDPEVEGWRGVPVWEVVTSLLRPASDDAQGLVQVAPAASFREIFRRFWPDARPFWRWLWLSLVLVIVVPLLDAAAILLFKVLVDDVLTPQNFPAFPKVLPPVVERRSVGW